MKQIKCPLCGGTVWSALLYEHCEIGFGDCSPELMRADLVACRGCGIVRVDGYPCWDRLLEEDDG